MSITHHTYVHGAVQSLGFDLGDASYTVGVVMPGEYDFEKAERRETIHVILGELIINDHLYSPSPLVTEARITRDRFCTIEPGESIRIIAATPLDDRQVVVINNSIARNCILSLPLKNRYDGSSL